MPETTETDRELKGLEADLRQLEAEYNMYFAGRLPRPPVETRARVTASMRRIDRLHLRNTADRFRFVTLQSRFQTFLDLWERGLRAREEGRPGPFAQRPAAVESAAKEKGPQDRILHVAAFHDPTREMDKLHELYERLADARREAGEDAVPFHKFAELVKTQVERLQASGNAEVAFRVAMKDGKVNLTARALHGPVDDEE